MGISAYPPSDMLKYPNRNAISAEVFSQRTLEISTANVISWQQGAGAFGKLHLHGCWSDSSVIGRRYQGQSLADNSYYLLRGAMQLHDHTGEDRWRCLAEDIVANTLYLQAPEGGFYHASGPAEPTYTCQESCPIHQGLPLLGLLDYYTWSAADPHRKALIPPALEAHWKWFREYWWRRGPGPHGKKDSLEFPAFCAVTNQDLVIVAFLARYARIFGDARPYDECGSPALETFLSPRYYYEAVGLFERGDSPNFVERTSYNEINVRMLALIHENIPHPRLPGIIDNVTRRLFDAIHVGPDGMTHFAWGAEMDPIDKSRVKGWVRTPYILPSYPGLIKLMVEYLERHPDPALQAQLDSVEHTVAAYTFADGTLPTALGGEPLFAITTAADSLWLYLIERLGDKIKSPAPMALPVIHRRSGSLTWKANQHLWALDKDGRRAFGGLKQNPAGIVIGPEEVLSGADFSQLETAEIVEEV